VPGRGVQEAIISGIVMGLITALLYYCGLALFQGIASENLDDQERSRPNEGIRRSLYGSAKIAVVAFVMWCTLFLFGNITQQVLKSELGYLFPSKGHHGFMLMKFLVKFAAGFLSGWNKGRVDVLLYGAIGCLLVWLLVGGQAVIRHGLVRVMLWWEGRLPWNVARFLNYSSDMVLMRKVGGGYMFMHRLLQEYFVSIEQGLGRRKELTDAKTMPPVYVFGGSEKRPSAELGEQTVV
jgi:hypothetical protein